MVIADNQLQTCKEYEQLVPPRLSSLPDAEKCARYGWDCTQVVERFQFCALIYVGRLHNSSPSPSSRSLAASLSDNRWLSIPSPIVTEFNRAACASNASERVEQSVGPFAPPFSTALTNAADAFVHDLDNKHTSMSGGEQIRFETFKRLISTLRVWEHWHLLGQCRPNLSVSMRPCRYRFIEQVPRTAGIVPWSLEKWSKSSTVCALWVPPKAWNSFKSPANLIGYRCTAMKTKNTIDQSLPPSLCGIQNWYWI